MIYVNRFLDVMSKPRGNSRFVRSEIFDLCGVCPYFFLSTLKPRVE